MEIAIPKTIIEEMISHSKECLPNESCGYLSGHDSDVKKQYKMTNSDASPEHFSFEPKEQFATLKSARQDGQQLLAVYHSHPESPARLSDEDMRLLKDPNTIYIIVSLMDEPDVKAFHIKNNHVTTVTIKEI